MTDLEDLRDAITLQHIAKVKDISRVGAGDSRDHTLTTQNHPEGHLLATHLQSLTVLENSSGWAGKVFTQYSYYY